MPEERLKSPRARLFVALELPAAAHSALHEWQRDLTGRCPGELRIVPDAALHLTMAFLGYRAEREIPAIVAELDRSVAVQRYAAAAVTLFRSHLEPAGARYEALKRIPLSGSVSAAG